MEKPLLNGRTGQEIAAAIALGIDVRNALLAYPNAPFELHSAVVDKLELEQYPGSTEGVSFFMRGAFPFISVGEKGIFVVFYNPLADVAIVSLWVREGQKTELVDASLVPGEYLKWGSPDSVMPRALHTSSVADNLHDLNQYMKKQLAESAVYTRSMLFSAFGAKNDYYKAIALRRIGYVAMGASKSAAPCWAEMSSANVKEARSKSQVTNIAAKFENQALLPVGGYGAAETYVGVFALRESPSDFIFIAADRNANCRILTVNAVETIGVD